MKNIILNKSSLFFLIVILLISCPVISEARRAHSLDLGYILTNVFSIDSEEAGEHEGNLKVLFSENLEFFQLYTEKFRELGVILESSGNSKSMYLSSIARDLIVLADSLKDIEGGFNSLMNMVLNVAEIKKDAKFLFQLMRSLDVAINNEDWLLEEHFSFSMDKITQLVVGSNLRGGEILSQLKFLFNKAGNDKVEYSRLVEEFIFKNSGCCFNLPLLNASNGLGAVSFDWGSVLSLIMSNIEIRDNVRNMLTEFRERGIEVWIITRSDADKVYSRLKELDSDEEGSFCWSDCFEGRVVHALPAELSPAHTKGAYLRDIAQDFSDGVVVHFDDSPEYSNLGMLASNLISIGVVATGVDDIDFRDKVSDLSGSAGIVVNLGFDYSKMFQALGLE